MPHGDGNYGGHNPEPWNDRQYENFFDPGRTEASGARFLEVADQIRLQQLGNQLPGPYQNSGAAQAAPPPPPPLPDLGGYCIPDANTWAAHVQAIKNPQHNLSFDPAQHYFDEVIAKKLGAALSDPAHEGLRTNIAVLRNDIMGMFDPIDDSKKLKIIGIAETLADALANDKWWKRPFTRPLSVDVANVEGVGAAEMYKHLLLVQSKPGILQQMIGNFRQMLELPDRIWALPPLEQTPFSDDNLRAASPPASPPQPSSPDAAEPTVSEPDRKQAVIEAHTILRWLKNLQGTNADLAEWLNVGTPPEQLSKTEALQQLVEAYRTQLQANPDLANHPVADDASDAAGALALAVINHTLRLLPADHPAIARLEAFKETLPENADLLQDQSVARLLENLTLGFERLSGKMVGDVSPVERLVEMSKRIQANMRKFKSVDTLEPPVREESIELAHIILEYLKKLSFSNNSLEKIADTGRPEDKAALAQKIEEMVDNYKNLLFEAAIEKPELLQDPRILAANDAVSQFGHVVSLMAAKEMPGSIAAAQQISAAEDQSLEHLHGHHLDRVLASAQGSTKSEASSLGQDEQTTDDKVEAMEAAMAAIEQLLNHKKKRGKSRSARSGKGGKRQQRASQDITADDYVLKQGRFSDDTKPARVDVKQAKVEMKAVTPSKGVPKAPKQELKEQKPAAAAPKEATKDTRQPAKEKAFMGLDPKALAAIQKEGGNLRDINKQLKDIPAAGTVAPDDKTLSQRLLDAEQQKNRPGGPNSPRVG